MTLIVAALMQSAISKIILDIKNMVIIKTQLVVENIYLKCNLIALRWMPKALHLVTSPFLLYLYPLSLFQNTDFPLLFVPHWESQENTVNTLRIFKVSF